MKNYTTTMVTLEKNLSLALRAEGKIVAMESALPWNISA
jgi:hypothetical protein